MDSNEREEVKKAEKEVLHGWVAQEPQGAFFPYLKQTPMAGLPAGSYDMSYDRMRGPYFQRKNIMSDKLVLVEGSAAYQVLREIEAFVARRQEFIKRGFMHKRGVMLTGAPGSGKTSTINVVAQTVTSAMDGVVLYTRQPGIAVACLQKLREIEPNRLALCVMEDVDTIVEEGDEEQLLALMDGEDQIDNIVYLATTNYPENLPERIWDRPSRFDSIVVVDDPSDNMRAEFLKQKEPDYTDSEIARAVRVTKGFTISHLKELIVLNKCLGHSIEQAAKRITDTRNNTLFKRKKKD